MSIYSNWFGVGEEFTCTNTPHLPKELHGQKVVVTQAPYSFIFGEHSVKVLSTGEEWHFGSYASIEHNYYVGVSWEERGARWDKLFNPNVRESWQSGCVVYALNERDEIAFSIDEAKDLCLWRGI